MTLRGLGPFSHAAAPDRSNRNSLWLADFELFVAEVGDQVECAAERSDVAVKDVTDRHVALLVPTDPGRNSFIFGIDDAVPERPRA